MERSFVVTMARFHRTDPNIYVVQGYFQGNSIAGSKMTAQLDGKEISLKTSVREGLAARQKYFSRGVGYEDIDREYDLWITLPKGYESTSHRLKVFQELDGKVKTVLSSSVARLKKERRSPDGYLETFREQDGQVMIGGWAVGSAACRYSVLTPDGERIEPKVTMHYRQDITDNYPEIFEGENFGFEVSFPRPTANNITLVVASKGQRMAYRLNIKKGQEGLTGRNTSILRKGSAYLKRNGVRRTIKRVQEKLSQKFTGKEESYMEWRKRHQPTKEELAAQDKNMFLNGPLISIVVPLYKTPEEYLKEMVASVRAQTYKRWELCLSDGSGADSPLTQLLEKLQKEDTRIRVVKSDRPLGISENTNHALAIARGDFIAFADHDDLLPRWALYECVKRINEDPGIDMIYSDEDKVSMNGKTYFEPHFKTDFNIDLLCSMNYFCHLVVVRRDLFEKAGMLDPAFDGAQDYDFVLRCVEKAEKICHIPQVLYHWRSHADSTAENPESKRYAFEAGQRAIQAHYNRLGIDAEVMMGQYPGLYRTVYHIPDPAPMISIIIPNKDHSEDLDKCVRSIMDGERYPNYEFVIVENNSVKEETFEYYRRMEQQHENFHVLYWNDAFNYSLINNFGVEHAKGDYLLFLNNDTSIIASNCLEEMMGPLLRKEVGIVGARLFYEDDTIQHAGVIIGYGGIAGHAFMGFPASANGYFSRIICQSDLSAVTAACMMVRRDVFEELNGFDGTLRVAFNDIDFCLRAGEAGKLVVYNPFATLHHYESKSRGAEDTPEKIARFNGEADQFLRRWPEILQNGDPYYNPNLSLDRVDFGLKK